MPTQQLKLKEVMTSPVVTIGPDTAFPDIVDTLLHNDVSGLPVVDDTGHLLGIVTEADLVSKEAYGFGRRRPLALVWAYLRGEDPVWVRKAAGRTARDLMTANPITATPSDTVASAARRMLLSRCNRLPVVDNDVVVGIVTRHDLLTPFHRTDEDVQAELAERLADPLQVPETHNAEAFVRGGIVTLEGDAAYPMDVALIGAVAAKVVGVVGVDNRLTARAPDPAAE